MIQEVEKESAGLNDQIKEPNEIYNKQHAEANESLVQLDARQKNFIDKYSTLNEMIDLESC